MTTANPFVFEGLPLGSGQRTNPQALVHRPHDPTREWDIATSSGINDLRIKVEFPLNAGHERTGGNAACVWSNQRSLARDCGRAPRWDSGLGAEHQSAGAGKSHER